MPALSSEHIRAFVRRCCKMQVCVSEGVCGGGWFEGPGFHCPLTPDSGRGRRPADDRTQHGRTPQCFLVVAVEPRRSSWLRTAAERTVRLCVSLPPLAEVWPRAGWRGSGSHDDFKEMILLFVFSCTPAIYLCKFTRSHITDLLFTLFTKVKSVH